MSALSASLALRRRSIGFFGLGNMGTAMFTKVIFSSIHGSVAAGMAPTKDDLPEHVIQRQAYGDLWSKTLRTSWDESRMPRFWAWDKSQNALENFEDEIDVDVVGLKKQDWFRRAAEPADIARNCSVILTMLPSSPHVADLYLGPNGIVPTLKKLGREVAEQTLCIDHTSLDHTVAQEVAKQVRETGARMIDAPVSGGVNAAIEGKLSFMVGGEEESVARAEGILQLMGKKIFHCGDSGSGMAAKICNNLLLGISMTGTAEAMLLGSKLGLKPEVLAAVINSSTGRCWASELNNPVPGALPLINPNPSDPSSKPRSTSPADRNYAPGFKTSLMAKDLGLAINAGGKEGLFLPLGSQVRGLYDVMASRNWGDRDFGVVYKFLEGARKKNAGAPAAKEGEVEREEEEKRKKVEEKMKKSWEFETRKEETKLRQQAEEVEEAEEETDVHMPSNEEAKKMFLSMTPDQREAFENHFGQEMWENMENGLRQNWKDSVRQDPPEWAPQDMLTDEILEEPFAQFLADMEMKSVFDELWNERKTMILENGLTQDETALQSFLADFQERVNLRAEKRQMDNIKAEDEKAVAAGKGPITNEDQRKALMALMQLNREGKLDEFLKSGTVADVEGAMEERRARMQTVIDEMEELEKRAKQWSEESKKVDEDNVKKTMETLSSMSNQNTKKEMEKSHPHLKEEVWSPTKGQK